MDLRKLDKSFYPANLHLEQALDLVDGKWIPNKVRGHSVVLISVNNLTFGIPLRSNIRHTASHPTQGTHGSPHKGLDYSKALLISKPEFISDEIFRIPNAERTRLKNKAFFITRKFEQYVKKYIKAVNTNNTNIINSEAYRFTTLRNYHQELGLSDEKRKATK
ncbi:MAG: type III toxin-antitoxin system TenpIN family toxin [Pontibacterium sp.]